MSQHAGVGKIKYSKELRSRYAKFVQNNHNRVVCDRDREPNYSRTPVKKLKHCTALVIDTLGSARVATARLTTLDRLVLLKVSLVRFTRKYLTLQPAEICNSL